MDRSRDSGNAVPSRRASSIGLDLKLQTPCNEAEMIISMQQEPAR